MLRIFEGLNMFTGIISDIGTIIALEKGDQSVKFRVLTTYDCSTIAIGASIACAGACLTVVKIHDEHAKDRWFEVEAFEEALRLTTLGTWGVGHRFNLERALKVGDELGGHIVSGHVDAMAEIIAIEDEGDAKRFTIRAPHEFSGFIAPKGSITLDGTSLTVNQVSGEAFDVLIIRHSLDVTSWGFNKVGDKLNFEVDTMARYAARLTYWTDCKKVLDR
jgi:riboflavin synthase